ncbi:MULTISPECIES: hypothetical protein [Nostoc]|uniref:Uncharacterized protein n=2 Tax=Nostoc TaxID=1177 RepID=A0ABR8IK01_9NOSO|nr:MULTISPECIES: hypothetical protein [Nostoc]MBD2560489.1 hypothetical protein [Nostoc linckia FACHB-391]MBD2651291.1 hypothetical protein [Nostoc foliaceum FACHB-393]
MQKPLTCDRQGFVIELNSILSQTLQKYRNSELSNYISDRRLTKSLDILEKAGYSGNTAIFMLAYCQKEAA